MKELLQKLTETGDEIYAKICEVTSVDIENQTADLQPLDGSSQILDACVFVTKETAVVVNHSEIKQFQIKIEKTEFKINAEGFLLKKENETLAKLMTDLLQEIQKMKFTTYAGGPTLTLLNKPKFIEIENRFKKFLKED